MILWYNVLSILNSSIQYFHRGIFMKVAIVGSRDIQIHNIERYIADAGEIISGGAKGVDTCAANYAREHGIKLTEFLPQYTRYGRAAPIVRNKEIVDYADLVIIFWNGSSKGTRSVIDYAKKIGKPHRVILCGHDEISF